MPASWTAAFGAVVVRHIERGLLLLDSPDAAELDRAYLVLKQLPRAAFDWSPSDVPGLGRFGATRMRQYVRALINTWDFVRLDPDHEPDTEVVEMVTSYDEDAALEQTAAE